MSNVPYVPAPTDLVQVIPVLGNGAQAPETQLSQVSALGSGGGGGTVTRVVAGTGLAGGTITATGTISLAAIGASDLLGNTGTISAAPVAVTLGPTMQMVTGTLDAVALAGTVFTGTITTASLVGKTITVTGGVIVSVV